MIVWELLIVVLLILLNGVFAMTELAVVSARRVRLQLWAENGQRGAAAALCLAAEPSRFLSTVQIGITLIGIFAGAYGGATIAGKLSAAWADVAWLAPYREELALGLVVAVITYLSLIVGELVPKQLALRHAEVIAAALARPMIGLARLAAPLVWLLDISTRATLRLLGGQAVAKEGISDEEIKLLITEAAESGVVEQAEQAMIAGVMRLADRPVRVIMTPRPDIVWLDLEADAEMLAQTLRDSPFSRFPVGTGDLDEVLGIVQAKDLLDQRLAGQPLNLKAALREVPVVHENAGALRVLDILKQTPLHLALVIDEYGSLEGLVTATDILASIVGELAEQGPGAEPEIVRREDGSWLLDGGLPLDELKELLRLSALPGGGHFHTLAGLVLSQLEHLPAEGEHFLWQGYRFEVLDMDGRRIDKVLVSQVAPAGASSSQEQHP